MVEKVVCPNGVRIVHELIPHFRSAAIGIWIQAGSADETEEEAGIAHFIEHMLFKGTTNRSAKDIAEQFDRIGGELNAFTSKEMTCFYATVLNNHAELAVSILSDMLFHSLFEEEEIRKEVSVIADEIAAVADTPDDLVEENLWSVMYPNHPIGRPILGNEQTLASFTKAQALAFMKRVYTPDRIVISIAGNYNPHIIDHIQQAFSGLKQQTQRIKTPKRKKPVFQPVQTIEKKDIEQAHICIGFPCITLHDHRLYALSLLDSVIGGTMSSRLFQQVREERGLAYSVFSFYMTYYETGAFIIYGGTASEHLHEMQAVIEQILQEIIQQGITATELENAKEQLKCGFLLGLDSVESRMHRIGKNELLYQTHRSFEEVLDNINEVTAAEIHELAKELFTEPYAVSIITADKTAKMST